MTIYFTSDLHFNHNKDFLYEPRGFSSIVEHDYEIIERWNSTIRPGDTVYFLGDIGMSNDIDYLVECISILNGDIKWILGNHDSPNRVARISGLPYIEVLGYGEKLKVSKNTSLFLCHYPVLTMPRSLDGELNGRTYSICGHSHTKDKWADWNIGGIYHVELDAHNCYPVSLEDIMRDIKEKNEGRLAYL